MNVEREIQAFTEEHRRLLELERDAEIEEYRTMRARLPVEELERRGLVIRSLQLVETGAGLGGRLVWRLEPSRGRSIDAGRIGTGDIVVVRPMRDDAREPPVPITGVLWRVSSEEISIAMDGDPEPPRDGLLRIDRVANDITYRRLDEALSQLSRYRGGPADRLRKVLFGAKEPEFDAIPDPSTLEDLDPRLDPSQRDAVALAMAARDVALIHGPPGTGKTTTLVEVIVQAVRRGERVIASAASNIAVDNLVERLAARGLRVVRIGHPARLLPTVLAHSLENLVREDEAHSVAGSVRRDLERAHRDLARARDRASRYALRRQIRELSSELRELEAWNVRRVLEGADVILATNIGAADSVVAGIDVDLIVLDEAAQAIEAGSWIPLLKGRRAVLSGDHRQLPPTIRSLEAERKGLGRTLFERQMELWGDRASRMLTIQYRMHEKIMNWSSNEMYDGRLIAHESVRKHLLADLPGVARNEITETPFIFFDTAGCGLEEEEDAEDISKHNAGERRIVRTWIERLEDAGVEPSQIAVITPYNAQVRRLRRELLDDFEGLEVGTVDGFQGREKEAVVISMVRSNEQGEVGFLADARRMNVAVTRARRHVALIGDSATVGRDPFLRRLIEYAEGAGEYRTAWELM
ncbi:MAG TPA: IGHMBP2 family helicase [Planctomycetota bacterium]|nr:IGHMBP2 family helicase [Planctomycetota bacterium]